MSLLINLDDVPAKERSRSWSDTIRDYYFEVDIGYPSRTRPAGKIVRSKLGSIVVSSFTGVAQYHDRSQTLTGDDVDYLFGWIQLRGRAHAAQEGREVDLDPGQFVILDAARPFRTDYLEEYQTFTIRIPRVFAQDRLCSRQAFLNVRIGERQGSVIIADYFRRVARGFDRFSPEQKTRIGAYGIRLMLDTVAYAAAA